MSDEYSITLSEAGRRLGVSCERVRQYVAQGLLKTETVNNRPRVLVSSLETFIPRQNWVGVRRSFQQDVSTAINELKTSQDIVLTPGEIFGRVVKSIIDSPRSHQTVNNAFKLQAH